ncbi:hypothetical protein EB796_018375 [Bugula neritina]|uniref:Uncharacterized protein n=1 Tax=Bugula neritina TaxID=10212 RepID=A0A7J7JD79_BUGNE|nr:hypothetical protein EB796_018375 [Bugula neritina]
MERIARKTKKPSTLKKRKIAIEEDSSSSEEDFAIPIDDDTDDPSSEDEMADVEAITADKLNVGRYVLAALRGKKMLAIFVGLSTLFNMTKIQL